MRKAFGVWILAVFLLFVGGCTSAPELASYPRSEIDRPYTLPDKVATWSMIIPFGFYSDSTTAAFLPPIPVPLFWRVALSDKWTLNWSPLPTSVSYEIDRTADHLVGASLGLGFGYGTGSVGLLISPAASLYYRQKLNRAFALEVVPRVDASFRTGGNPATWTAELGVGPLFQLNPLFALRARATLRGGNGLAYALYSSTLNPPVLARITVPLSIAAVWSVNRQWDLGFGYIFEGIGYQNSYSGHTGVASLVHYW